MFITVEKVRYSGDDLYITIQGRETEEELRLGIRDLSKHGVEAAAIGTGSILEFTTLPRFGTNRLKIMEINLHPPADKATKALQVAQELRPSHRALALV